MTSPFRKQPGPARRLPVIVTPWSSPVQLVAAGASLATTPTVASMTTSAAARNIRLIIPPLVAAGTPQRAKTPLECHGPTRALQYLRSSSCAHTVEVRRGATADRDREA